MCSEGVSVWFACKLCKSFFLNADDFAYHKKKSHVQEFRSTKFIVFEEQTTPTASPPENWVSFLSPKEETQIHKIISLPPPLTTINVDCNRRTVLPIVQSNRNKEFLPSASTPTITDAGYHPSPSQEIIRRNPNVEFLKVDTEINKIFNDDHHSNNGSDYVTSDLIPISNHIPDPTTEINLNCADLLEIVKTEYESDGNGNEDNEFHDDEDHDPFESESQMESFEEGTSVAPANFDDTRARQSDLYCISCKKYFSSMPVLRNHYKYHHRTQEGKRNFECPYPNCGKTIIGDQCNLKSHIRQKHSSARPFKCPHPGCTKSFKVASSRNRHLKLHFVNVVKPDVG